LSVMVRTMLVLIVTKDLGLPPNCQTTVNQ
jgi:hypothetical protein